MNRELTDNELIARFMRNHAINSPHLKTAKELEDTYNCSWDWLMPVVEKISKDYDFNIHFYSGGCTAYVNKQNLEGTEIASYGNFDPNIINVYNTVVAFIRWHNQNKWSITILPINRTKDKNSMIKVNFTVEKKNPLTKEQLALLNDVYGALWVEAYYDPRSSETREFARPLAEKMSKLNEALKFKK
jgi:hypothetical protein